MYVVEPGRRAHVRLPGTRQRLLLTEGQQVPDEVPAEIITRLARVGLIAEAKPAPKTQPKAPKGNTTEEG